MKNASGFTLVELMVTVLVAGILVSIAMPSFQQFLANTRIASAGSDLSADLAFARSEAMRRGGNVRVCASTNATSCGGNWAQGWILVDANNALIRTRPAMDTGYTVTTSDGATTVQFRSSGYPDAARTWTICRSGSTARTVSLAVAGRTTLANGAVCP